MHQRHVPRNIYKSNQKLKSTHDDDDIFQLKHEPNQEFDANTDHENIIANRRGTLYILLFNNIDGKLGTDDEVTSFVWYVKRVYNLAKFHIAVKLNVQAKVPVWVDDIVDDVQYYFENTKQKLARKYPALKIVQFYISDNITYLPADKKDYSWMSSMEVLLGTETINAEAHNPRRKYVEYDDKVCALSTNELGLTNTMRLLYKNFLLHGKKEIQVQVFPYCCEKVVGHVMLDKVNRPKISKRKVVALEEVFGVKYKLVDETFRSDDRYWHDPAGSNPSEFMRYMWEYFEEGGHLNKVLIVSHGKFMRNLFEHMFKTKLEKKDRFDNLDIFHIILDTASGGRNIVTQILRYPHYKGKNLTGKVNVSSKHILLMRHCIACHNVTDNPLQKLSASYSGSASVCLRSIGGEINFMANNLQKFIDSLHDKKGQENIVFGSSIVFRAMLTATLLAIHFTKAKTRASASAETAVMSK